MARGHRIVLEVDSDFFERWNKIIPKRYRAPILRSFFRELLTAVEGNKITFGDIVDGRVRLRRESPR